MKITKYYEFVCDECGCGNHPPGNSIKDCIKWLKKNKGVIKDGFYFCDVNCYELYIGGMLNEPSH